MARVKSVWIADDGTQWATPEEAVRRDELDAKVRAIEATFPHPPDDMNTRLRVGPETIAAKEAVIALCRELYPHEAVFQHPASEIHPHSYAGRFLSEVRGPLNRVWWRFSCCADGWMYKQPFYALNPGKFREFAKI